MGGTSALTGPSAALLLYGVFAWPALALGQELAPKVEACLKIAPAAAWWTFDQEGRPELAIGTSVDLQSSLRGKPVVGEGRVGHGLHLSSAGEGISVRASERSPEDEVTLETWLRTGEGEGYSEVVRWVGGTSSLLMGLDGGRPTVRVDDGPTRTGAAALSDGRWHHLGVVVTRAGASEVQVFVDGDPVSLAEGDDKALPGGDKASFIGGTGDQVFIGALDELAIHQRALRRTEIVAIWAAGKTGKCR